MSTEFPPNSAKSRKAPSEEPQVEKKIERVISGEAKHRKKSLGRQFKETFIGGDTKTAVQDMVFGVFVPSIKDAIVEAGQRGIERLILGETRYKSAAPRPGASPGGHAAYTPYNRFSQPDDRPPMPNMSNRGRSSNEFGEIVLQSRREGEIVIESLGEILSKYGQASVSDLYDLIGLKPEHTDHKWGWTDIRGSRVVRTRGGLLLDLPAPHPLA